jgi:undecaprenyl diphosphate synthase
MNDLNHVAFIMDGNGRWGLKKKKSRNYGHLEGVKTVQKIVQASISFKIPIISFYVFSTENWKRPSSEINYLFNLITIYFNKEINNLIKNNIKIVISGRLQNLSYCDKTEIIDEIKKINSESWKVKEENIDKNLYTNLSFPDILVRTGGQKRLSNFMLWQLAYTEIFFLDKLWPDFKKNDLSKIIKNYHKIKRNFGEI